MSTFGSIIFAQDSGMLDAAALKKALRSIPAHAEITQLKINHYTGRHVISYACLLHDPEECMSEVDDDAITIDLTKFGDTP